MSHESVGQGACIAVIVVIAVAAACAPPPSDGELSRARAAPSVRLAEVPAVPAAVVAPVDVPVAAESPGALSVAPLALSEQRRIVDLLASKVRVLEDEVSQWTAVLEHHDDVAATGLGRLGPEMCARLTAKAKDADALVTDVELRRRFQTVVLDALSDLAKSPTLAARAAATLSLSDQQDVVDQLRFEVEVVKEDIRQAAERSARRPYVMLCGIQPTAPAETIERLTGDAYRATAVVTDAKLNGVLQTEVLDVLTELAKSQRTAKR